MFMGFLSRIMGGDEALVAYLHRVLGYCLTGDVSEQAIFFSYGVGQNGKTVLMSTVSGILSDYCLATPIETFTEGKTDRHPTELARMRGARLVTATETEAGRHWAESRLKELTGGERVPARFMHKNFFEFAPEFKPWHFRQPSAAPARRRRRHAAAAEHDPVRRHDPRGRARPPTRREAQRRMARHPRWMIDGCLDWQERGLAPPEAVTKATDAYFAGRGRLCRLDSRPLRNRRWRLVALVRAVRLMAGLGRESRPAATRHETVSRGNGTAWLPAPTHKGGQFLCRAEHPARPGDRMADPVTAGDGSKVNRRIRAHARVAPQMFSAVTCRHRHHFTSAVARNKEDAAPLELTISRIEHFT